MPATRFTPPPAAAATALSTALPFRVGGAEVELPQRIKILAWGQNDGRTTGAKIIVDDQSALMLPRYQVALGLDKVVLDFEHQSHDGHPNFLPDPRDVPGHGEIEIVPGEGVFLSAVSYTPAGQKHAANYADVSAVAHLDDAGRLLYVSSVALTQHGDVAGMEFAEHVAALSAIKVTPPPTDPQPQHHMDKPDYRQLLIAQLGLKPDDSGEVSDEAIAAAVAKGASAALSAPAAQATPASQGETVETLSAKFDQDKRDRLIRDASKDGKVIPLSSTSINSMRPEVLSELIDKLPGNVVAMSTTQTGKEKPATQTVALSAEQSTAAKALGLTAEEYLKGQD